MRLFEADFEVSRERNRFGLNDFVERGVRVNMTENGYREDDRRKFVYDVLIGQDVVVTVRVSENNFVLGL